MARTRRDGGRRGPELIIVLVGALASMVPSMALGDALFSRSNAVLDRRIAYLESRLPGRESDPKLLMALGEEYTLRAQDSHENRDYEKARTYLERSLHHRPRHLETRGWLGLLTCGEARDLPGATAKTVALRGLAILDEILEADPKQLLVRLFRGMVGMTVPRSWGRLDQALEDLHYIEYAVGRDPSNLKRYGLELSMIYLKIGKIYLANSMRRRAREYLEQSVRSGPPDKPSKHSRKAARLLARHFPR